MSQEPENQEKKIIIDEDWKAEAQAEKEKLEEQRQAEPGPDTSGVGQLPPATLEILASTIGMQAMVAMGLIPNPITNQPDVQLDQAKHFIDTLAMLQEKTEGNRTPEESAMLESIVHELRMGFVAIQQGASPTVDPA